METKFNKTVQKHRRRLLPNNWQEKLPLRPLLFGLGMRNEAKGACHPAHTRDWDIDEDGLSTGVKVFVQFVLDYSAAHR